MLGVVVYEGLLLLFEYWYTDEGQGPGTALFFFIVNLSLAAFLNIYFIIYSVCWQFSSG